MLAPAGYPEARQGCRRLGSRGVRIAGTEPQCFGGCTMENISASPATASDAPAGETPIAFSRASAPVDR